MKLDDLLNEIERLDKKATEGEWNWTLDSMVGPFIKSGTGGGGYYKGNIFSFYIDKQMGIDKATPPNKANLDWIIFSRTALPLLAQYVKRYRESLEKVASGIGDEHMAKQALEWTPEKLTNQEEEYKL